LRNLYIGVEAPADCEFAGAPGPTSVVAPEISRRSPMAARRQPSFMAPPRSTVWGYVDQSLLMTLMRPLPVYRKPHTEVGTTIDLG
jgi:hypothetical protein